MKTTVKRIALGTIFLVAIVLMSYLMVFAEGGGDDYKPAMYSTFWALVPPIVAIGLALITKEVYSSLFIGIVIGGLFYSNFTFEGTVNHVMQDGIVSVLSDTYNVGILVFLVVLGVIVALMNKTGASAAFGRWAEVKIKTRLGAQLATVALGVLIFVDDYFNCLTVGSVMRPITDKHKVSRAKLAYLIDATAAPVCIIAPISSWAAAVTGFVPGEDGFTVFLRAIPYNYYALLTIFTMIMLTVMKFDFGPMRKHEDNAIAGDLYTTPDRPYADAKDDEIKGNGTMIDLVLPVVILIILCALGMLYTGGFFSGENFVVAFSNSDASVGLSSGSVIALLLAILFYSARKVLSFNDCMECIPEGFKAMVSPILILTFAWSLKAMTDSLGAAPYVANFVESSAGSFMSFLPGIIFIIACLLGFATGTSWGTFGILIPIVVAVFENNNPQMMIISISACMAGAVCGDHCSPISDTTIMASAGAQCNHINHVNTQLPYAMTVAAVSFVSYIVAGFVKTIAIALPVSFLLMLGTLMVLRKIYGREAE